MERTRYHWGWLNVLAAVSLALVVLMLLVALNRQVKENAALATNADTSPESALAGIPMEPNLAAYLHDGETVEVHFASGLSVAGSVRIPGNRLTILNPLGSPVNLGEVARLVKVDGQVLVPAEFGIPVVVPPPAPTLAPAATPVVTTSSSVPDLAQPVPAAEAEAQLEVAIQTGDLPVSTILDQYPKGTLFAVTLQNGEEVTAMKVNRLKLVRVDGVTGATSKTLVPPWMIVSLQPVSQVGSTGA